MLTDSQRASLEIATARYETARPEVAAYLAARGIPETVADMYRLGFVADPEPGHEQFRGRLAIPYITPAGVVDIRFRSLGDVSPKYLSRPAAEPHLFNVLALSRDVGVISVCEGEFDTIVMDAMCDIPAVGVPGANLWQPFFVRLFADYDRVLVWCDGDEAGRGFGKTVAKAVEGALPMHLPQGMDVNDVFLREGAEGLRRRAGL